MAGACPDTKMVLGGFSQGAAIVDAVTGVPVGIPLAPPMDPVFADRIAAVAVFGNPSNRVGGPITALSPLFGAKAIDLCNGADPICSDGRDVSAHSLYVQSGMTSQAASFVAGRV
jgi:cutinase